MCNIYNDTKKLQHFPTRELKSFIISQGCNFRYISKLARKKDVTAFSFTIIHTRTHKYMYINTCYTVARLLLHA